MLTVNSEVKKIYGKTVGKTHSKTGVSPIEFNANNQGLISWSMLGNGQQTGTPTPDAPIMPDFCGVRTENLAPPMTEWEAGYISASGSKSAQNSTNLEMLSDFIAIPAGSSLITFSRAGGFSTKGGTAWRAVAFYNANKSFISRPGGSGSGAYAFNVPDGALYTRVMCRTYGEYDGYMLNTGGTALPYEPYGWKIPITCAGQTTPVYLGQVQTVRRVKKLVLTGTESWSLYGGGLHFQITIDNQAAERGTFIPISNAFNGIQVVQWDDLQSGDFSFSPTQRSTVRFRYDVYEGNLAGWKSYLAQQYATGTPVTVWYVLATPETAIVNEPLAKIGTYADELRSENTTVTIPTQTGANTISVDTVVPPSSLTIQYTSPDISEIVRAVDSQGKPLYGPRYGFKIDKSQTDSASAIIYTHDAVTMTPAYMDYTNGSFNYGSWGNVWFVKEAKPVALNLDGTIAYYLDPDDYTKKIDGTNSDIFYTLLSSEPSDWSTQWKQYYHLDNGEYVLNDDAEAPTFAANTYYKLETSFTGNFMVKFPKVYFKRYEDANYNYVEVSDRKLSRDFKAYAHLNANGDELDFIYLPMFKGVIQSSKLRSIPGVIPQGGTTASAEVTAAEACGTGWQIWDHSSREMINDLLILMSKSIDCQTAFGRGRESGYNAGDTVTYGKLPTGTAIRKGPFYGSSTSLSEVKVFGMESFWANRWDRLQGILLVDNVWKIKMTPPYNFTGTDFTTLTQFDVPSGNGYLSKVTASQYGSIPASISGGASNKFYRDYFYKTATGTRVGLVGGSCRRGSFCGFRCVHVSDVASTSYWDLGASPIYK